MGGKRPRAGQYLYVCLAGILFITWYGCAHDRPRTPGQTLRQPKPAPRVLRQSGRWQHLQPVQEQIENRDFEGALRTYQEMLSLPPAEGQPDLVLFDLGLLCSHYANPRKDYNRAHVYFSRLLREHPGSPLLEEAKIWVNVLETMERTKRVDIELEERSKALQN